MANNLSVSPWVLDTASATPITAEAMRITKIRWVGATAPAHTAVLTDSAGHVVWSGANAVALADGDSNLHGYLGQGFTCKGLVAPTLASGKLYVYYA